MDNIPVSIHCKNILYVPRYQYNTRIHVYVHVCSTRVYTCIAITRYQLMVYTCTPVVLPGLHYCNMAIDTVYRVPVHVYTVLCGMAPEFKTL